MKIHFAQNGLYHTHAQLPRLSRLWPIIPLTGPQKYRSDWHGYYHRITSKGTVVKASYQPKKSSCVWGKLRRIFWWNSRLEISSILRFGDHFEWSSLHSRSVVLHWYTRVECCWDSRKIVVAQLDCGGLRWNVSSKSYFPTNEGSSITIPRGQRFACSLSSRFTFRCNHKASRHIDHNLCVWEQFTLIGRFSRYSDRCDNKIFTVFRRGIEEGWNEGWGAIIKSWGGEGYCGWEEGVERVGFLIERREDRRAV